MAGISSKAAGEINNKRGYNGNELQSKEFSDGSGLEAYDFGRRMYDQQTGHFDQIDPKAADAPGWSPYNAMWDNPIRFNDPDGAWAMPPDEFDQNGNKISNLGGDKIDFYHQKNGDTKIVDRASGASNIITGGESIIRDYTQRNKDISWSSIFQEFRQGTGPTKSMIADFDNTTSGAFGSLNSSLSSYSSASRKASLNSSKGKDFINMTYENANPFVAQDMWEQMWGRTKINWYKLGDKTLFLMTDSKSRESLLYHHADSWERSEHKQYGNTYQTYIWTETNTEVQSKVYQHDNYYQKQIKQLQQEIKLQKF